MSVRRVYLHYPFCSSYCRYCNFSAGAPPKDSFTQPYFKALFQEMQSKKHLLATSLDSLYFGGGTPSLIPHQDMSAIFDFYSSLIDSNTEITLEINPETVTKEKAQHWKNLGINRVSLGWQSMDDQSLALLNRSGRADDNKRSFLILRDAGFDNISVDRILSIRDDHTEGFYESLHVLRPEHVSTYQLSIEKRTVLHAWCTSGQYHPFSDEEALAQEAYCEQQLLSLGYERYEISNYARNKAIGKHNAAYWDYEYYLGLGSGASEFIPEPPYGVRRTNPFSFLDYIKGLPAEEEKLNLETAVKEALMTGVRKRSGIDKKAFQRRLGISWKDLFSQAPDSQFFEDSPATLLLRHDAIPFCNPAILSLWQSLSL